jgi:hypothetical protein
MGRTRDISNIFDDNSPIVNSDELNIAINTASAAAASYADSELAVIDLSSTIQTASAAAVSYADSLTTTDISEGNQLYFTNQRSIDAGSSTYILQINEQSIINTASGAAVTYLVDSAPGTLDTLNELAAALNDDASFASTVTNSLSTKLDSSTASTTYLTITNASTTYLSQSDASNIYEPNIDYVSSSPSTPIAGTLWIDSTASAAPSLKVYNGSEWIAVSGAGGGGLKTHFLLMGA